MNFSTVATSARRPASRDRRSSSGPLDPLLLQSGLRVVRGPPVRRVDLVRSASVGEGDEGVAGDRDRDGTRFRPGRHVQQDDRVGVQLALVHACPQLGQQLRWQRVARRIRAAVQSDEQCRERLLGLRRHGPAADDVAGDDAIGQRPLHRPAVPGADQQRERQHRGDRAPDRPGDQANQVGGPLIRTPSPSGRPRGRSRPARRGSSLAEVGARHTSAATHGAPRCATSPPGHGAAGPDVTGTWSPHHDRPARTPMSITVG